MSDMRKPRAGGTALGLNLPRIYDSSNGRPGLTRLSSGDVESLWSPVSRESVCAKGAYHGDHRQTGAQGVPLGLLQVLHALAVQENGVSQNGRVLHVPRPL